MKKSESFSSALTELLRYFGFPLLAVVVVIIAFFATKSRISAEIQKDTYQILRNAALNQRILFERYTDLLTTRTKLIAGYNGETEPETLVELLRGELQDDAENIDVGFADLSGEVYFGKQTGQNVAGKDWFLKSSPGITRITTIPQIADDDWADVLVSTRVHGSGGLDGVLFAVLSGKNFSDLLETQAYEGAAYSFVGNAKGIVLFLEEGKSDPAPGEKIFEMINRNTLEQGYTKERLKNEMHASGRTQFRFRRDGKSYYAVCEAMGIDDWHVFSIVPADAADGLQRQVGLYQMGMLFIMLLAGTAMAVQAYNHERASVQNLKNDRDLLQQSAKRYQLISQLSNEVFFQVDLNAGEISFNDSFESMFGAAPPACKIDQPDVCRNLFFEQDQRSFLSMINRLRAGDAKVSEELRMLDARGIARWKRIEIFSVFDQSGQAAQLVGKIADIHRQKQSMQRLIRQADSEPLTGLLNRAAMERNVNAFLSGEGADGSHALLILDFDNFKAVNDSLGHANGDNLLVSFAAGMRHLFRSGDYLSRVGGDEYMIFVKGVHDDGVAMEKGEAMRAQMAELSRKIGIPVSISVGIAVYPRDGSAFDALYHAADAALYRVKNSGKNAVAFFSDSAAAGSGAASNPSEPNEAEVANKPI